MVMSPEPISILEIASSPSKVSWTELYTASFHLFGSERMSFIKLLEHRLRLASSAAPDEEFYRDGLRWSKPIPNPPNLGLAASILECYY